MWAAAWTGQAFATERQAEDAVKAAFVLRFPGYVEWPTPTTQATPPRTFDVAVLGNDVLGQHMSRLAEGRSVMNLPVRVRRINSIREVGDAHVLYIAADHRGSLRELIAPIARRGILIVTNEDNALAAGSMINLLLADRHVRFEVSLPAAHSSQLRISSELLALAVRVQK